MNVQMNVQMKKLSMAIMLGILGGMPLAVYAESQTDDEIINNGSPDIELNDTTLNEADWEICVDNDGCSGGKNEAIHFVSTDPSVLNYGLVIENFAGGATAVEAAVTIDSQGRVGIGTDSPSEELEIHSTVPQIRLNDTNSGSGQADIIVNGNLFAIENVASWDAIAVELNGGSAQNNQLYLDSTGRVGIKVANPIADLQVGGGGDLLLENGSEDWGFQTDSAGLDITRGNNGFITPVFRIEDAAPSTSLVIDDSGNIGIGTNGPSADIHVRRSGADMLIEDINGATGIRNLLELRNKGPVGFKLRDTTGADDWAFRTGGGGSFIATKSNISGPVMSFGGDGSVSLGQNPGSAGTTSNMFLSSVGNLSIQGSFMTPFNTYADYVFASDYKLMPLDELQTFVKANKHLPNVLSEAEVKETNMINVSELQITQLAKIEELTLYTLQQHKQIKEIQQKLEEQTMVFQAEKNSLQQRLSSLEKLVTNIASASPLKGVGQKVALNK